MATTGMTTAMAVLPPVLNPLEPSLWAPWRPAGSVLDGLLTGWPALLVACDCWLVGVMTEVMVTTAWVCPEASGDGVTTMIEVRTSVADGGAEAAVVVLVTAAACELCAGGAADDAAGAGALEAGGAADDGAGAALEGAGDGDGEGAGVGVFTGADEGAGAAEDGASAEDGALDCAGAGEDGAGAAEESAARVTEGEAGEEAAGGDADCTGLDGEGAIKEETNVLAVPLLDMLTTIGTRNHNERQRNTTQGRRRGDKYDDGGWTERPHVCRFQKVKMLVSRNAAVSVLVTEESRKNGR
jgi:hypothetical protein